MELPYLIVFLFLAFVVLYLILASFFTVSTAEVAVITSRFGKFLRVAELGLNWKRPFFDSVAGIASLRVNQITLTMAGGDHLSGAADRAGTRSPLALRTARSCGRCRRSWAPPLPPSRTTPFSGVFSHRRTPNTTKSPRTSTAGWSAPTWTKTNSPRPRHPGQDR